MSVAGPAGAGTPVPAVRRAWWREWGPPVFVLVLVCAVDLIGRGGTYFVAYLLVAPAIAAILSPPSVVLAVGAVAVPERLLLGMYDGVQKPFEDNRFLGGTGALIFSTIVFVYFARLRQKRERQLADVTSVALAAQHAVLRPQPAAVGGVRIGLRFLAAAAEAEIGGDLYEVLSTPYGVRVVIGDVRGKGLEAVQSAAVVLGAFREAAYDVPDLADLARKVEASVRRHLPPDDYVTALFVEFRAGEVRMLHRGHVPALLVDAQGEVRELRPPAPGTPLGLGHLGAVEPCAWTEPCGPHDVLVLVTDGVVEARRLGIFYPFTERLGGLVRGAATGTLQRLLRRPPARDFRTDLDAAADALRKDLLEYTEGGRISDDAVIMLLAQD
ncbi:PP2C family protein-serine/threonine phosphatase [Longispora sp. K20-0274]|uniref:PP2C family protein-serine/threonine phosphatase n=1 Tax=Longispora sp. K20-0274 TaxID=3088255 RepID=UPI00399B48A8